LITQYLDLISRPSVKINSKKIVVRLRKVFVTANIRNALSTAFKKANEGSISEFYDNLEEKVLNDKDKYLSHLEDAIKETLVDQKLGKVLEEYLKLSFDKKCQRDTKVSSTNTVGEYIDKQDWRINANANVGYSNAGMVSNISGKLIVP
jgi:ribonucleoside-triphosphate reductase